LTVSKPIRPTKKMSFDNSSGSATDLPSIEDKIKSMLDQQGSKSRSGSSVGSENVSESSSKKHRRCVAVLIACWSAPLAARYRSKYVALHQ